MFTKQTTLSPGQWFIRWIALSCFWTTEARSLILSISPEILINFSRMFCNLNKVSNTCSCWLDRWRNWHGHSELPFTWSAAWALSYQFTAVLGLLYQNTPQCHENSKHHENPFFLSLFSHLLDFLTPFLPGSYFLFPHITKRGESRIQWNHQTNTINCKLIRVL